MDKVYIVYYNKPTLSIPEPKATVDIDFLNVVSPSDWTLSAYQSQFGTTLIDLP